MNNQELQKAINQKGLQLNVEGKDYEWKEQYITGLQIKELANIPSETEIYLSISKPYKDELIENDKLVNLARPTVEYFFVKKKLHFTINKEPFTWYKQFIRGIQLRELGKIRREEDLYLDINDTWEDDFISDDEIVDLARPGREIFFSKKTEIQTKIIVNGREKLWDKRNISFEEVIVLAEGNLNTGNKAYTVTYLKGPKQNPEGEMAKGDLVFVTNKMIFNATATDKS